MTPRREMTVALGLLVVGAAVALLGGSRSTGAVPGVPAAPGTTSGAGAPTALALVAFAGAGATLLVRNRGRTLLGAVLVLVGAATVVAGVAPTRWATLVGGALIVLGALAVTVRARRWPQPRSRYDAPVRRPGDTPRDTWEALDRGEDPTA